MKAEPNSSKIKSSWQQEQEKEQRRGAWREKPKMEPSKTAHPRGRNRASHMAGTKSCTNQPQGAREVIPRTTGDQIDPHLEERAQEGKNAISLKRGAREAMTAASGATWKVQKRPHHGTRHRAL